MANVWAGDPGIVSVWNFESGNLTLDSIAGTTILTAVNAPTADTGDYRQGTASTNLAYSSKQFYKITDANLPAGFPLKSGDTTMQISFGCWFKAASYSVNSSPAILGKGAYGGGGLNLYLTATTGLIQINWNGVSAALGAGAPTTGAWYHVAVCADGKARSCWVRLYNSNTGIATSYICATQAGDLVLTAEWRIGAFSGTDADRTFDGKIDEAFVFKRTLSEGEIDAIRSGSFTYSASSAVGANDFTRDKSCVSLYRFESGALTTDTKAFMTLNASATAPASVTADVKEGSGCAQFSNGYNSYYYVTDTNLPSGFPTKSTEPNRQASFCCWVKSFDYGNRTIVSKWISAHYSFILFVDTVNHTFKIIACAGNSGFQGTIDSGIKCYPGEWYHVAATIDGGGHWVTIRVYRASTGEVGGNAGNTYSSNLLWLDTADFRIGGSQDSTSYAWNGYIDEFVVFNRVLNISEIDAIRSGIFKGPLVYSTPNSSLILPDTGLARAVNNTNLSFAVGGDTNWSIENNETHDGCFAARSGTIGINQESWITTSVSGPGKLTFWWAIDSTSGHHYLNFQIDGSVQDSISGPNNPAVWAKKSYTIPSGTHTLKWRYFTDGTAVSGRNLGWVDEIFFGEVNDFTGDANCKALYNFENNIWMGFDSLGTTHLNDGNGVAPYVFNTALPSSRVGSQPAVFWRSQGEYLWSLDTNLAAGFPLKNGDTTKTGTFCFWMKLFSNSIGANYDLISKGSTTTRSFNVFWGGMSNTLNVNWGYSGGNQDIILATIGGFKTYNWYHVSISFDGVNKRAYCRVWDDEAQQIVADQVAIPSSVMQIGTTPFTVGAHSGSTNYFDGCLDEVVIYNRQLSIWQMDAVRKGLFSGTGPSTPANDFSSDSTCKAQWRFESGAKLTDSKSTNNLTDHSTTQIIDVTSTVKEGSGCVQTVNATPAWLNITDGGLAAGFPLKSGDATKQISVCLWFRSTTINAVRYIIAKSSSAATKGSFLVYTDANAKLFIRYFYGTVNTYQDFQIGTITASTWYHLGFTIDGVARKITTRLYTSSFESSNYSEFYSGQALQICNADFTISGEQGASTGTIVSAFDGFIDEVVVFNRLLGILEIDAIRQGTYSGTGIEGIATDFIGAMVAFRTDDHQVHFCVDPVAGKNTANDGLSYSRPWQTHKARFLAPGDYVTFPASSTYLQAGTVTVTNGSYTVSTSVNLTGQLVANDVVTFGTDNVLYTIDTISSSTITLYRPYRGSSAPGVSIYKLGSSMLTDWYSWNTNNYQGKPDLPIQLVCGVDKSTGLKVGWTVWNQRGNDGVTDGTYANYVNYYRFAIIDPGFYSIGIGATGGVYEDFLIAGLIQTTCTNGGNQATFTRWITENCVGVNFTNIWGCTFNDLEMFNSNLVNMCLGSVFNSVFNRFKAGNGGAGISFNGPISNVTFNNPTFDDGIALTEQFYFPSGSFFLNEVSLINAKLNPSTPMFGYYNTAITVIGSVSFEHYNQTQDDNRTFIFNGDPQSSYAAIMYRDAVNFKTSAPSDRIDLIVGSQSLAGQKYLVPASLGIATTISVYVKFNAAYLNAVGGTLPYMVVRTLSGTSPDFIWVDTVVTSPATANTWNLLTQTVIPSRDSVLEVFLYAQSLNPAAQIWFDEFDVTTA